MAAGRTAPVRGLAVGRTYRVHLATLGHRLEGPVDGRQPDPVTAHAELLVDLLRGTEVARVGQELADRGALSRRTSLGVLGHHQCSS